MTTLFGSLLALVLLGQAQPGRTVGGTVVDEEGKPIAGATVELLMPASPYLTGDPAPARATTLTDGNGRFEHNVPADRIVTNGAVVWAYRPGRAVVRMRNAISLPPQIVLSKSEPRSLKIEGPDGKPVAGARVEARLIVFTDTIVGAVVPAPLAPQLAVTTGPDGTASLAYLRGRDRLAAARVTADSIGEQVVPVAEETPQGAVAPTFVIKLKRTSRLSGRIVDEGGKGLAGQTVEIWSRGETGPGRLIGDQVGFKNGPVRTSAGGAFQTPDCLMIGSSYRAVVRNPGKESIISDWIEITEGPVALAPLRRQTMRSITGRVIDRQGKPVADVEIFQSVNGPAQTVRTDADGRFELNGLPRAAAFLFARADGFRFHGQVLKPCDSDVTIALWRTTERPERELTKLPDLIPLDESRAMARRIMERWWQAALEKGDELAKYYVVEFLMPADSVGALQKIAAIKFPTEQSRARLQSLAARAVARTDFDEGETVAESIADPAIRAGTLTRLADILPGSEKPRKLAILERALIQARVVNTPSDFVYQMGEVAGRFYELGETEKAKQLFALGLARARQDPDVSFKRRSFAALLARVDLPVAMELAKQVGDGPYGAMILPSIAFGLRWDNPAEAHRFWREYPPEKQPQWLIPVITWKVATLDPKRARQLVDTRRGQPDEFEHEFCLALGAKGRDEAISSAAIQAGLQALDLTLKKRPQAAMRSGGRMLAIAEAIDPALVEEVMWLAIAGRPPSSRAVQAAPGPLFQHVAWYDRDVAAALLEPLLQRMEKTADRELVGWEGLFSAWTLIDPRAAVARLEKIAMTSVNPNDNRLWIYVVEKLALDRDERWRKSFIDWAPIFDPHVRDFMFDRF